MWPMLWKEFTQRKKNVWITLPSVLIPAALFAILMVENFEPEDRIRQTGNRTISDDGCMEPDRAIVLYYYPRTELTRTLMSSIQRYAVCIANVTALNSSSEVDAELRKAHLVRQSLILANKTSSRRVTIMDTVGMVFWTDAQKRDFLADPYRNESFHVEIRTSSLETERTMMINEVRRVVPIQMFNVMSLHQNLFEAVYMNRTGNVPTNLTIQFIPTETLRTVWSGRFAIFYGYFIMFGVITPLIAILRRIVEEKAKKLKILMQMSGVNAFNYFFSIFIAAFAFLLLVSALFVAPGASRFHVASLIICLLIYSAASVLFTMAFTSVFQNVVSAIICFIFAWFILIDAITNIVAKPGGETIETIFKGNYGQSDWIHLLLCVFATPNYGLHLFLMLIEERMAMERKSVTPLDFIKIADKYTVLCPGAVLLSMLVSCIFWIFAIWYVRQVWPQKEIDTLPFHFPISQYFTRKQEAVQPMVDSRYFEEVPKTLKTCVLIDNVSKTYAKHVDSLKHVHLCLYFGQITALLGSSGAGKTTLMKILAGFIKPTHGTVVINGYDISKSPDYINHNVGFCPQERILFNELSVEEHLYLFGYIKGFSSSKIDEEVDRILGLFGLLEERKHRADSLSRQSERLLQLAIAFVGKPKILILDEPTVGLDVEKRRKIWDLLHTKEPDSMVLFATTLMEEADNLAERIAIISEGEIKAYGTPKFLKDAFKVGYYLMVQKGTGYKGISFGELLKKHFLSAKISEEQRTHVVATIDWNEAPRFPYFLGELEEAKERLGIKSYGLDVMSMEDVFVKAEYMLERSTGSLGNLTEAIPPMERKLAVLKSQDLEKAPHRRLLGLLVKRLHITKRNLPILLLNIIWICYMTFQLRSFSDNLTTVSMLRNWTMNLDGSVYQGRFPVYCAQDEELCRDLDRMNGVQIRVTNLHNVSLLNALEQRARNGREYFLGIRSDPNNTRGYSVIYNNDAMYSKLFAVSIIYNRLLLQPTKGYILTTSTSITTIDEIDADHEADQWPVGLMVFLVFIFIFPWPLLYVTNERISQVKLLQYMAGVSSSEYWISNIIFDLVVIGTLESPFIISTLYIDLVYPEYSMILCDTATIAVLIYAFAVFVMSSICVAYVASFLFDRAWYGYTTIIYVLLINYAIRLIKFFLYSWKTFLAEAMEQLASFLLFLFQLMPLHDFTNIVVLLAHYTTSFKYCNMVQTVSKGNIACENMTEMNALYRKCCRESGVQENDGFNTLFRNPKDLVKLIMPVVVMYACFTLFIFLENASWFKRKAKNASTQGANAAVKDDPDVSKERTLCEQLISSQQHKTKSLVTKNLTKTYNRVNVVDGVSIVLENKQQLGIVGLTNSGKSVLLKMIVGSLEPTRGEAYAGGKSLLQNKKQYRRSFAYCPQENSLIYEMTGREMLVLFARLRGVKEGKIAGAVEDIIRFVDLENTGSDLIEKYNSFNRRKLSLALALVGLPEVLVIDDPGCWLDLGSKIKIWQIIKQYHASCSVSMLIASRSLQECEQLCSKIAFLLKGKLKCIGTSAYLRGKYGQGFSIRLVLNLNLSNSKEVEQAIKEELPSAVLQDRHGAVRLYQISDSKVSLAHIYKVVENIKIRHKLDSYHIVNSNLQRFFLSFAKSEQ